MDIWEEMRQHLRQLEQAGLRRFERVIESPVGRHVRLGGRELVCLCANDYLALANDEAVKAAAAGALSLWGVGSGASRLVSGTSAMHKELERRLADFKKTQSALVTSTGWMANHAAIHAFCGTGDLILCDKLNHASIIDASISSGARVRTYPHCNIQRLEQLLARHRGEHRRCLIVTDSLFSMDGDVAPLAELIRIKKTFDAQLLIDEAHATGVLGEGGRGAAEMAGVEEHVDATVGTLSKALGGMGGFVAGPDVLIETIRNTGRPYIYTTALPPALCATAIAALDIVQTQPDRRRRVLSLAQHLRSALASAGFDTGRSVSHIIPIMMGDEAAALAASSHLQQDGFLVPAIRPPTVPRGTSRLRVSLCSNHQESDLDGFMKSLCAAKGR